MLWVGIDVGGTFTDIVVYDDKSGTVSAGKSPSTPSEPSEGVVNALKQLSVDLVKVSIFRHGSIENDALVAQKEFLDACIGGRLPCSSALKRNTPSAVSPCSATIASRS
ncbi:MAG TPA: hypothetical protein EYO82_05730, partial [Gammaproteobacteria bacterium]|nr:hypothetical protein [Gammaproteobacteria bacterium]